MLLKVLSAWAIGALVPLVRAQKKSTYDFENYPGDHKKWVPDKGCNMLIQAPANTKPWDAWNQIKECGKDGKVKVFPYCVSDQAPPNKQGASLPEVADLVYANKENGLNPAWGGDYFYVVYLPEATKKNREYDEITGSTVSIHMIDKNGKQTGPGYRADNKWKSDGVECPNPYYWTMEDKFVY